jgi:hypothetical protein
MRLVAKGFNDMVEPVTYRSITLSSISSSWGRVKHFTDRILNEKNSLSFHVRVEVKIQIHYDFARANALRGKKDLLIRVERLERDDSPSPLDRGFNVKVEKVPL